MISCKGHPAPRQAYVSDGAARAAAGADVDAAALARSRQQVDCHAATCAVLLQGAVGGQAAGGGNERELLSFDGCRAQLSLEAALDGAVGGSGSAEVADGELARRLHRARRLCSQEVVPEVGASGAGAASLEDHRR